MKKIFPASYFLTLLLLLIYSFSQIDLNLTLSSNQFYQSFQQSLIHLGYFKRPLSTLIYFVILCSLYTHYLFLIHQAKNHQLTSGNIIKILLTTAAILLFAYPAFSHDLFNYIFDARILLHHHTNPWTHSAQDFPLDLWTRFMHWTHRTYPYGPTWLLLSLPFYLLGLGKFTLTLISFKAIGLLSYLLAIFSIYRLTRQFSPQLTPVSLVFFGFNPLILIESLVSAHLDIAMASIMLFSIWLTTRHSTFFAWASLVFSALIKYVSFAAFPFMYLFQTKRLTFEAFIKLSLLASYALTALVIIKREILPWYFITPLALVSLMPQKTRLFHFHIFLSAAMISRYLAFLYFGDYSATTYFVQNFITTLGLFAGVIYLLANSKYFSPSKR